MQMQECVLAIEIVYVRVKESDHMYGEDTFSTHNTAET